MTNDSERLYLGTEYIFLFVSHMWWPIICYANLDILESESMLLIIVLGQEVQIGTSQTK